jgi:hypothetical protein
MLHELMSIKSLKFTAYFTIERQRGKACIEREEETSHKD